ncbi:MAG TPA: exodeoxyribonuclease VII large subunit, partial [Bordetella sp.]|nr:exodeoxyribonuclease VII large subunit [Bordetella sp.]
RAIGVVTSLRAAALRDVLSALARRAPHVPVILYPAPVQGADAAPRLIAAIAAANLRAEVDTLLLVRGGGSIEDLWSFNDEGLARAVAASAIPVISGVGHETDFTIVDFVSDIRAPTPTAAAELACVPRLDLYNRVMQLAGFLVRAQERRLERLAQRLDRAAGQLTSPGQRLAHQRERLATLRHRLANAWAAPQARRHARIDLLVAKVLHRGPDLERVADRLQDRIRRLQRAQSRLLEHRRTRLASLSAQLRAFDPQHVLARGYALVRDDQGHVVRDAASLAAGQALDVLFSQGSANVAVIAARPART